MMAPCEKLQTHSPRKPYFADTLRALSLDPKVASTFSRTYFAAFSRVQNWSNCSFVHLRLEFRPFLHSSSVGLMTIVAPGFVCGFGGVG